jgi:hypothetical protein
LVLSLCCFSLLLPQPVIAAGPSPIHPASADRSIRVVDVALGPQGTLDGQVVDPQGIGLSSVPVILFQESRQVAATSTGEQGRFTFKNLPGGVYGVMSAGVVTACRLWAPHTAPPSAKQHVLIVSENCVARGQSVTYPNANPCLMWIDEHPLMAWGILIAAIVAPLPFINPDEHDDNDRNHHHDRPRSPH